MQREGIELEDYEGTWYVIDETCINGTDLYLLESEDDGDERPCIIIDEDYNVINDEVWNGFNDLDESEF